MWMGTHRWVWCVRVGEGHGRVCVRVWWEGCRTHTRTRAHTHRHQHTPRHVPTHSPPSRPACPTLHPQEPAARPTARALLLHPWITYNRRTLKSSWSRTRGIKARAAASGGGGGGGAGGSGGGPLAGGWQRLHPPSCRPSLAAAACFGVVALVIWLPRHDALAALRNVKTGCQLAGGCVAADQLPPGCHPSPCTLAPHNPAEGYTNVSTVVERILQNGASDGESGTVAPPSTASSLAGGGGSGGTSGSGGLMSGGLSSGLGALSGLGVGAAAAAAAAAPADAAAPPASVPEDSLAAFEQQHAATAGPGASPSAAAGSPAHRSSFSVPPALVGGSIGSGTGGGRLPRPPAFGSVVSVASSEGPRGGTLAGQAAAAAGAAGAAAAEEAGGGGPAAAAAAGGASGAPAGPSPGGPRHRRLWSGAVAGPPPRGGTVGPDWGLPRPPPQQQQAPQQPALPQGQGWGDPEQQQAQQAQQQEQQQQAEQEEEQQQQQLEAQTDPTGLLFLQLLEAGAGGSSAGAGAGAASRPGSGGGGGGGGGGAKQQQQQQQQQPALPSVAEEAAVAAVEASGPPSTLRRQAGVVAGGGARRCQVLPPHRAAQHAGCCTPCHAVSTGTQYRHRTHLNRLLLPAPLGPVTSRLVPAGTRSDRSRTSVVLPGVTTTASSNTMASSHASTWPSAVPRLPAGPRRLRGGGRPGFRPGRQSSDTRSARPEQPGRAPAPPAAAPAEPYCAHPLPHVHPHPPNAPVAPPCALMSAITRCMSRMRSAYAPSFMSLREEEPRVPMAPNREMMTEVWYRMLLSIYRMVPQGARGWVGGWVAGPGAERSVCGRKAATQPTGHKIELGGHRVLAGGAAVSGIHTTPHCSRHLCGIQPPPQSSPPSSAHPIPMPPAHPHLRTAAHCVLGAHVSAEEGADDEVNGHGGTQVLEQEVLQGWQGVGGGARGREHSRSAGGVAEGSGQGRREAGVGQAARRPQQGSSKTAPTASLQGQAPGTSPPPPTPHHPPPHLQHAKPPLLAQHPRLVLHHVAEGGPQHLALLGHAAVEGHALRVGAQPRLRGGGGVVGVVREGRQGVGAGGACGWQGRGSRVAQAVSG